MNQKEKWTPKIIECPNPENCDELHNEAWSLGGEDGIGADCSNHHSDCECQDCMTYAYLFLK